jgi:hypothetical protein
MCKISILPWETRPRDGKFFICVNKQKELRILNEPPNCALGIWKKHKKDWRGNWVNFEGIGWAKLPSIGIEK